MPRSKAHHQLTAVKLLRQVLTPKWISLKQIWISKAVEAFCFQFSYQLDRSLAVFARMTDKDHLHSSQM